MKNLVLLAVIVCCTNLVFAQHEIGVSIGTSHLLGDFGGEPAVVDIKSTMPSAGLFYRYNFLKFLSVRGQFMFGALHSNDAFSENSSRLSRGFSSKSLVLDGSLQLEFNIIPLKLCCGKARVSPYIATGIGFANVNASITSSNPEGIPSSESQYIQTGNVLAFNLPITAGVKYKTNKNIVIALEGSYRIAFTDRLDAYVREKNDHFFFISANVSYVFCKGNKKRDNQGKCPTFYDYPL